MPRLANQSFFAPPSYERSTVDNGECSGRWRAEPAQGQDDPVENSCPRLPRHTQKAGRTSPMYNFFTTSLEFRRWANLLRRKMLNLWRCNSEYMKYRKELAKKIHMSPGSFWHTKQFCHNFTPVDQLLCSILHKNGPTTYNEHFTAYIMTLVCAGWVQCVLGTAFWSMDMTGVYACLFEVVCDVTTVPSHLNATPSWFHYQPSS